MFGIGSTEFLVIIVVAILVLGPEHLPKVMRTINKAMSDFRRVSTDFQRTMNLEAMDQEKAQSQPKPKKKKKNPAPEATQQTAETTEVAGQGAPEIATNPPPEKEHTNQPSKNTHETPT